MKRLSMLVLTVLVLGSCTVIREGEVGVKRTLGTYKEKPFTNGLKWFNPFTTSIVKVSTQTENLEVGLTIPSKEGLNIQSEVSILYNVIPTDAPGILRTIGPEYERNIILPVFRSAVADVSARFFAKDMHTGERGKIEEDIRSQMDKLLQGKGIEVEAVLLKSIQMPPSLARAIEEKLEAEQNAQRMEFILLQEKQEAERKRIQAEGVRDAQNIISQGLDPMLLQFKAIEAFMELSKSNNAKVIITDGKGLPMMINPVDINGSAPATPGSVSSSGVRVRN
ncbi:MAG: prohibitin family protein [Haliscomenobacter sp.]|nr:prohibitin family protein [Haliscomenobacter sp.]MBP9077887.1 prohibitin family protein [Haliscomenobacter sp.]